MYIDSEKLPPSNCKPSMHGFTLVEMAIVLVIIGLIVGGVLVGKDLIQAAETRKQIQNLDSYNSAANTFRTRFRGIPGDIRNFTNFIDTTSWASVQNGNGDKKITDADNSSAGGLPTVDELSGEITQFWLHLSAAQLIGGSYDGSAVIGEGFPLSANTECGVGVAYVPNTATGVNLNVNIKGNAFQIGILSGVSPGVDNTVVTSNCLSAAVAYDIDAKIDDGKPLLGTVQSTGHNSQNTQGYFFGITDIFDIGQVMPEESFPVMLAKALFDNIIGSAYAAAQVAIGGEACVLVPSSAPNIRTASTYNVVTDARNCQLAIKAGF